MRIPTAIHTKVPRRLPKECRFSNYAINVDGIQNYVEVTHSASINLTINFSVEFWFNSTVVPVGGQYFVSKGAHWLTRTSVAPGYPVVDFTCQIFGVGWRTLLGIANIGVPGVWHHVVCTYDGINMIIYVDGVLDNSVPQGGATVSDVLSLLIGRFINGRFDEVRVLPLALSADQVRESLHRGYARRELDARLVLRIEEGSGLTAYDSSGYGNNGSLLPALTPPTWTRVKKLELLADAEP